MIIHNKFVFIHNPHTGGSFIRNALKQGFPNATFMKLEDWHMPVKSLEEQHRKKLIWGVVRNPWEWYASFYCHQQPNGFWLRFFAPKTKSFKEFLTNMNSLDYIKPHLGSKYHPVGNPYLPPSVTVLDYMNGLDIGFVSYRYVYMFYNNYDSILLGNKNIFTNHDDMISVKHICRNEKLVNEMLYMFESHAININNDTRQKWSRMPKENSKRKKRYTDYYENDKELINLVQYKDRLIINKYNYQYGQ